MINPHTPEPYGYFRAMPFGWEDCAETDEGAEPLYDAATVQKLQQQREALLVALKAIVAECIGPDKPYSTDSWLPAKFTDQARAAIASVEAAA